MPIRTTSVVFVRKDATTLAPNAFLTIPFHPANGLALFNGRGASAPPDAIIGGDVTLISPNADDFINEGLFGETLRAPDRERVAATAVPLDSELTMENVVITEPIQLVLDDGFEPRPPEPRPLVHLDVFRETNDALVLTHDFVDFQSARLPITDVPTPPVGFAPEQWRAVFTNISGKPIQCFGRVLFQERRRLDVTTLPLRLLNRLLRQAVAGLGLQLKLSGDSLTVDFSFRAKEDFGLRPITKNFGFSIFGDIRLTDTRVELGHGVLRGEPGHFPRIRLITEFEEEGPELSIDLGVGDVDVNLSGLNFELDVVMRNRVFPQAGNGHLRGDFPWVPFITSEISVDTDARFSSRALGVARQATNALLDVVEAATVLTTSRARIKERIPTLRQALIAAGQELAKELSFSLSNFLQVAIQAIVNRDFAFHGIRVAGADWEVRSGPVPPPSPAGGGTLLLLPPLQPLQDPTPIDGPQAEAERENLLRINHIVLLMLENRSYDHVLGHLTHPDHGNNAAFDGLTGGERNAIAGLATAVPTPMTTTKFFPSPPHEFDPVIQQIDEGNMSGFGEAFKAHIERANANHDPRSIMNFHVRGQLVTYDRLIGDFAVAKRWFAALPGPTFPNRLCSISGRTPFLNNREIPREELGYLKGETIFDLLDDADINWRYYEHDLAFLRMLERHRLDSARIRGFELFVEDALAGLPAVTFIDPNFVDIPSAGVANDDHPGGADMVNGQRLVAEVINAVMASPGWNNTLLVVTYDEHGGFYDHVAPPGSVKSQLGGMFKVNSKAPEMLGVRVPAFLVSPRAIPGDIVDRIYDHTSVLKSILVRFLPGQEHRLGRRVEKAAHLGGAVPLETPRAGIPNFALGPKVGAAEREALEPGSFHDLISSLANPFNRSVATIKALTPTF